MQYPVLAEPHQKDRENMHNPALAELHTKSRGLRSMPSPAISESEATNQVTKKVTKKYIF